LLGARLKVGAAIGIAWATIAAAPALASGHSNPIVAENRHAGTDRWDIPWAGYRITDDRRLDIKGYAAAASVLKGGSIGLRITTARHEPYTIDVFRLGYYHGKGGRLVEHLGPFAGSPQPACYTVRGRARSRARGTRRCGFTSRTPGRPASTSPS
jgi:hypothetical protein